jgi:glutamate N-acetyltransferase/amino-acid N-acetyltransferase
MVIALANGQAGAPTITGGSALSTFSSALHKVMATMAQAIAGDGEGATKFLEANVTGATTAADARMAAKAVIGSNLVKAAMFGQDPNWGRIIDALGNTSVSLDPDKLAISINGVAMVAAGKAQELTPPLVQQAMSPDKIVLAIDLGVGTAEGQAWGADLTYEYVHINSAYTS